MAANEFREGEGVPVPESRRRKKETYIPPPEKRRGKDPVKLSGPRWIAPVMLAMFAIGLVWVVVWYIAPNNALMGSLAGWNIAIGFVFIGIGFILSTKWR